MTAGAKHIIYPTRVTSNPDCSYLYKINDGIPTQDGHGENNLEANQSLNRNKLGEDRSLTTD